MNRAAAKTRKANKSHITGPLFADLAAAPDARFIYESIDAANSLLSILNSFIDPVAGLKYMPLKYSLFVIYAAVFLFKVRTNMNFSVTPSDQCRLGARARLAMKASLG